MYIDWITWSIFAVGLAILVIWIVIPVQEFKKLLKMKQEQINKSKNKE